MVNLINTIIIAIVLLNSAYFIAGEGDKTSVLEKETVEQSDGEGDETSLLGKETAEPSDAPNWVPAVGITCGILLLIVVVSIGGYCLWKRHQDR